MSPTPEPAGAAPVSHLLYLHGFRSSPQSAKARSTARHVAAHAPQVTWWCPQLPASPQAAADLVQHGLQAWVDEVGGGAAAAQRLGLIGSSLGGFYATVMAERFGCRAVLLNPAVEPARDLEAWVGEVQAWHSAERFVFDASHVQALRRLRPPAIRRPERYFAVIAKGDEVLDWREMTARYEGCRIRLLDGGDHALGDYEQAHLPAVMAFLGLPG
jgi:hypothetical protein